MESSLDHHTALMLLEWQIELGVTEAIGDVSVNRYELPASLPKAAQAEIKAGDQPTMVTSEVDPVADARAAAAESHDLAALRDRLAQFEHCAFKRGARHTVFAEGTPVARVMVIGGAPEKEEDRAGRPFVGPMGQLLDRMFGAIDLSRDGETPADALYLTHLIPWRLPPNREPTAQDIAMMRPFLERQIELVMPDFLILLGELPGQALLGDAAAHPRGSWHKVNGRSAIVMSHPGQLLAEPARKREAWTDLLSLRARMQSSAQTDVPGGSA